MDEKFTDKIHNDKLLNFLKDYCKIWTQLHFVLYMTLYKEFCNEILSGRFRIEGIIDPTLQQIDLYFCQRFVDEYKKKNNISPVHNKIQLPNNVNENISNVDNKYYQPQSNFPLNNEPYDKVIVDSNNPKQNIQRNTSISNENNFDKLFEVNVPKEPFVLDVPERDNIEYTLIIDSRDRDILKYPYPEHFTIDFENSLKNINKITIDKIITPNWNIFIEEPYTFIMFKELDNVYVYNGSNTLYSKVFSQVYPDTISKSRKYIIQYPTNSYKLYKTNPLASLTRLSPSLLKSDGSSLSTPTDVFQILDVLECVVDGIIFNRYKLKNIFRNLSVEYYNWLNVVCKMGDIISLIFTNKNEKQITEQVKFMSLGSVSDFLSGEFFIDVYVNSDIETIYNKSINVNDLVFYETKSNIKSYVNSFLFLRKISFFYSIIIRLQEYNARTIPNKILI